MSTLDHLAACACALASGSGPQALYATLDASVKTLVGHRLFTLLVVIEGGREVERIHTSDPVHYPLTGRKPLGVTPWTDHVIGGLKSWHGRTHADIEWAFFDHALIRRLGCGSCINVPVIAFGQVLGTMNVLDRENAYSDADVAALELFAPVLALPFARAAASIPA